MSVSVWFSGPKLDVRKVKVLVDKAESVIRDIRRDLLSIETSVVNGALEQDFEKLYKLLVELGAAGVSVAHSYSERAHLLMEYVRALRVRILRLGPRGISSARDEISRNLDDIELFIRHVGEAVS